MHRLVPMLAVLAAALRSMLARMRAEVVARASGKRVPWPNSSLLGEVYLVALVSELHLSPRG